MVRQEQVADRQVNETGLPRAGKGADDALSASCWSWSVRFRTACRTSTTRHGLSGSQLWALWQISARPGLRVSQLASALHIKPSTASNLLDKLELRQLVRRERRDTDNRVVRLHLTDARASKSSRIFLARCRAGCAVLWEKCRNPCSGICGRGFRRCWS
jgi:DNA-binding MarR family transcriptional regulator